MKNIPAKTRKVINREISKLLQKTYFPDIPVTPLFEIAKSCGYIAVQEDNTPWEGFFCGSEGRAFFPLSHSTPLVKDGITFYPDRVNNGIVMTWYKMQSGSYEIVGYLS